MIHAINNAVRRSTIVDSRNFGQLRGSTDRRLILCLPIRGVFMGVVVVGVVDKQPSGHSTHALRPLVAVSEIVNSQLATV